MTRPQVKPQNAVPLVKDFIAAETAARFASLDIDTRQNLPKDWAPTDRPVVVVTDDGGAMRWPVATMPIIRVAVWANGETLAKSIAGHLLGALLSRPVAGVARVTPGASIISDRDDRNGGFFASFTVNTTVRTIAL